MASRKTNFSRDIFNCIGVKQCKGFYDYYQVVHPADATTDESELGSGIKGELKGYTDGLHSPFGVIGQIAKDRGLTKHEVLWGDSWINLQLYSADAPKYIKGQKPVPVVDSLEELRKLRGAE